MNNNPVIHRDLFHMITGKELGRGIARVVYDSGLMPDCVIKCEEGGKSFQNVLEWEIWDRVQGTKFEKWFAPCVEISGNGSVLVQRKTTPATRFPEKMPAFLTDFKRTNYGIYKGRLVAHDYGMTLLMENGMTTRMCKAKWWDAG